MSKDYKNRIPAYRRENQRKSPARAWGWAGAAVLGLGGLTTLGMHLFGERGAEPTAAAETTDMPMPPQAKPGEGKKPPTTPGQGQPTTTKPGKPPEPAPVPTAPVEPRFSFYKVLPEKEVIIPENEIKTLKREEESFGKPGQNGIYMVQAGSFTHQQDAEKLKAQLGLLKIKAKLEMIKLENTAWFRVKVGPYASLADADKVRQYLRANKIDSVVQRATK
ncbi:Sporulation related domain-containing protein [Methylomagnum ishizawai]|uniref:Sporulation related domain-containing protein n=1 Tax=Methylomagnum ishizawai TaxID=1760988 RepID=A0A1Y6CWZ0_9GAMM|nr:SPOR domain-containing protein [Methylomagnum ishizawai]SMF95178.1 Sporulation related domain-containing protein [Methylomagnum ishizawai]